MGAGLLPAQTVAAAATESGLAPENIDAIVRGLAESGVEVVSDEPSVEDLKAEEIEEADDEPGPSLDDAGPSASADLVRVYLREIGRVALLTAADEVDLARRVEAGVFAAERLEQLERAAPWPPSCAATCSPWSATASGPSTSSSRPTCGWSCRSRSATPAAACRSST